MLRHISPANKLEYAEHIVLYFKPLVCIIPNPSKRSKNGTTYEVKVSSESQEKHLLFLSDPM